MRPAAVPTTHVNVAGAAVLQLAADDARGCSLLTRLLPSRKLSSRSVLQPQDETIDTAPLIDSQLYALDALVLSPSVHRAQWFAGTNNAAN
jgi:hypothetical protein